MTANTSLQPVKSSSAPRVLGFVAATALIVALLIYFVFQSESAPDLAWMAWTKPTAIFFCTIFCLLIAMFETTRGDRLFLSLLGSAFINLAWLGFGGEDLWKALGVCLVYAALVFTVV